LQPFSFIGPMPGHKSTQNLSFGGTLNETSKLELGAMRCVASGRVPGELISIPDSLQVLQTDKDQTFLHA